MNHVRHDISGNSYIIIFILISLIIMVGLFNQLRPVNPNLYQHITIEQGDTLWSIADTYSEKLHKNHQQFIKWVEKVNNISPEQIIPGQQIVIPVKS